MSEDEVIKMASHHGAKFAQAPAGWQAAAYRRGRTLPLVRFDAPTQPEAARMFCNYFNIKEPKK